MSPPVTESCSIRLPQDDVSPDCRNKRQIELQMKQDIYKLKPIGRTFNSAFDNPVPLLNMSSSQFIDFTLKDPFTRYHLQLYGQGKDLMTQLFGSLPNVDKAIESLDDYKEINNHFVTNIEALGGVSDITCKCHIILIILLLIIIIIIIIIIITRDRNSNCYCNNDGQ